jgi:hypothetical protein
MELYDFWVVIMYELGHHKAVREVSIDMFFGFRERDVIDHFIDLSELILIH